MRRGVACGAVGVLVSSLVVSIRVTGRVTLSNVRGGVGPIPRRGTINAVALVWDPRTEPGILPAAKPLTASWRC
jgi:hypothetical protein